MNILGLSQGSNLRIFTELTRLISNDLNLKNIGILVADYAEFKKGEKDIYKFSKKFNLKLLKEWESIRKGIKREPNFNSLEKWQRTYGDLSLWYGLLADRRLFFGKYCKSFQSYRSQYTEKQMLGILEEALENTEKLISETNPDIIFGFVPVTLHEYLILKLAEVRKIPVRILKSTKIDNYLSLNDSIIGLSNHIKVSIGKSVSSESKNVVNNYLNRTKFKGSIYEGMHLPGYSRRKFYLTNSIIKLFRSILSEIKRISDLNIYLDPHNPGYLIPTFLENFVQPVNAFRLRSLINSSYKNYFAIKERKYCLFPLHFEPEIALQIFARPFQNQIELAKNIALSLPPGMYLLVKEHPRKIGSRSISYYEKLLQIPNLVLAPADSSCYELVKKSTLVTVVTGNTGLEAAILGKPVIVFGEPEYCSLPSFMIKTCHNLYNLSSDINNLLSNYYYDESILRSYLEAIVDNSVPVDLYSTLYQKKQPRYTFSKMSYEDQLILLKNYVLKRFKQKDLNIN